VSHVAAAAAAAAAGLIRNVRLFFAAFSRLKFK